MKLQIIFLMLILLLTPAFALEKLSDFVNDEVGVISPQYAFLIGEDLLALKQNTSVEMAVAVVNTTGSIPIEEYSINLAHNVLGDKEKDNGILVLLAVADRAYRIEVGYGLEPTIPDVVAARIGREIMAPLFAEGNYEEGLLEGERMIGAILRNDTSYETQAEGKSISFVASSFLSMLILKFMPLLIFLAIFIIIMVVISSEKKKKTGKKKKGSDIDDFLAAWIITDMFGKGGRSGGGFGGGGSGGFGGFGGGGFGGGGFSGKF